MQLLAMNSTVDVSVTNKHDTHLYKWIGLTIIIVSAILSNLGVNIQKLSHVREEERPEFARRTYYTRPLWIFGMVLIFLGAIGDFEALGFAPQALVAAVGGGVTVLANVFFAHLWLGQVRGRYKFAFNTVITTTDLIGTLFIIIGVVLSAIANQVDDMLTLDELENQFFQPGFLIYVAIMTVILGVIFGEVQAIAKLPTSHHDARYRYLPFLYATASGIFGSFSILLAKCASILLVLTFGGDNQFIYFTTYLFVGGMIATLLLQTDFLNRALMTGDTLSVFPMFQCFWIGSSVIGGVVFYEKYMRFTAFEWICLPIALAFIIVGIYLLSKHGEFTDVEAVKAACESTSHTHLTSGHFGALMPLSPTYGASVIFSHQGDEKNEHTPLQSDRHHQTEIP